MKTVYKRPPLSARQLQFLKIHILKERKKVQAARPGPEASTIERTKKDSCSKSDDEATAMDSSDSVPEEATRHPLSPETPSNSAEPSSSPEQSDSFKNPEKIKESESETPEDIAKQITSLKAHLEELKAEKHRLFQQLKQVLHEEDEKKKMNELKQKQEMEKSMAMEFAPPVDPRLVQGTGGLPPKHGLPTSPTNIGGPGRAVGNTGTPAPKKQPQRVPLLPTPEGGPMMYRRQSNSGPFRHSSTDTFHSPSHPPYNSHHHVPGTGTPPLQRGGPYQDQRMSSGHSMPPQDVHVHGSHPGMGPPTPGITGIQQPPFQGVPVGGGYQYSGSSYGSMRNPAPSQPPLMQVGPPPFQQAQPPPQQVAPPPQGYHPPHDMHMSHMMQPAQFQSQPSANMPPHFVSQGGPGGSGAQVPGGQMVGNVQQHYPNSNPLHTPEQQVNLPPQNYSVHSKGIQDPRQQKMLEQQQQQQRVGLNPAYVKQVQESHHQGSPATRDRKME